jgi:dTDP-4-amino-4,6-dideoxygalactose transaminase
MTTGEGGMLTTQDNELAARMRQLSLHGMSRSAWSRYAAGGSWFYEVEQPGYKNNMTDMQAAIGIHQLRRLPGFIERRQLIAGRYREAFAELPMLRLPVERSGRNHTYHLFPVRLDSEFVPLDRSDFMNELGKCNIGTSVHFIPIHRHKYYRETFGYDPSQFPVAEKLFAGMLSLPLYPKMSDGDVSDVILAVKRLLGGDSRLQLCA